MHIYLILSNSTIAKYFEEIKPNAINNTNYFKEKFKISNYWYGHINYSLFFIKTCSNACSIKFK